MPRKLHTKSRSGYPTRKRRHIKVCCILLAFFLLLTCGQQCDEGWPQCGKCITAHRECEYVPEAVPKQKSQSSRTATARGSPVSSPRGLVTPASAIQDLSHLELLHHFCTVTFETLTPEVSGQKTWECNAVKVALAHPFVLHQILGIAALHLAHLRPEHRKSFQVKATELQNLAMTGFNEVKERTDSSSCGAILLFSSLLTLHVLADHTHGAEIEDIDAIYRLLRCFNLVSFSRKLLQKDWTSMKQSDLGAILTSPAPREPYPIPEECQRLVDLPGNSDLSSAAIQAYHAAIERLQYAFSLSGAPSRSYCTIRSVLMWPMELEDEFLNLLNARRPEALIILAYYGVLLHSFRDSWMVYNSGASLV